MKTMREKNISIVIENNQEYIRCVGADEKKFAPEMFRFYDSLSNVYLPLLSMCERFEKNALPFHFALVMPSAFCTLLSDETVQKQYISHLEKCLSLGEHEKVRLVKSQERLLLASFYLERIKSLLHQYRDEYRCNLLEQFKRYAKNGSIELLATCATHIYLPHYETMQEAVNAQIETGLYAHKTFFGETARGFWIPELAYFPGLEKSLSQYGVQWTVLDARSFLFSNDDPVNGIFSPCRAGESLAVFARDNRIQKEVFQTYAKNESYADINRDIAYELPLSDLQPYVSASAPRYPSPFLYWSKTRGSLPNRSYDAAAAREQCKRDALDFVFQKNELLETVLQKLSAERATLVASFSVDDFLNEWKEGIFFLENVFENAHDAGLTLSPFEERLSNKKTLQRISPYYVSENSWGYGENLVSHKNNWMMLHVKKASERMIDLACRFPDGTGLKARLLNLAARELMLSQSSLLAKMIDDGRFAPFAEMRFCESIEAFTKVFESLGSGTVSTEWLTSCESSRPIFPWINYHIFGKKK